MKTAIAVLMLTMFCAQGIYPQDVEVVGTIYEPLKPSFILTDDQRIYLAEGTTVHIYNLKDFKETARFGKAGEGPEEFGAVQGGLTLFLLDNQLVVNARTKLNFYSLNGKFAKTVKINVGSFGGNFIPVDNGFVGTGMNLDQKQQSMTMTISVYDRDFNKKKELKSALIGRFSGKVNIFEAMRQMSYEGKGDRIYFLSEDDTAVTVNSLDGEELKRIELNLEKVPLTQEDIDKIINQFGRNVSAAQKEELMKRFEFPEYYPSMLRMLVDRNHLFVMTWNRNEKGSLAVIYDTQSGKKLKEAHVPVHFDNGIQPFPFSYRQGVYYAVNELADEDEPDEVIYKVVRIKLL